MVGHYSVVLVNCSQLLEDVMASHAASLKAPGRFFLVFVFSLPVLFSVSAAQDTFESLSAEAAALADVTEPSQFVVDGADLLGRADAALTGEQLQSIQDQVGQAAAEWLQNDGARAALSANEVEFLVANGLSNLSAAQQAETAAELILEPDAMSRYSASVINQLSQPAGNSLTPAQRDALVEEARTNLGELDNLSFEDLKEHIDVRVQHLYPDTEDGRIARRQVVIDWAQMRDPASLDTDTVDWAMMEMLPKWLSEAPPQEIDATWEARINPPRNGEYSFAISPLQLSATREEDESRYLRIWLTVEVNGQTILEASPGNWTHESTPIQLQQDQLIPVKMTLRYRMADYVPMPAAGQLYWRGPGIANQLIDPSFYRLSDADEPGVKLSVTRKDASGTRSCETIVDSIDQILGKHAICTHERTLNRYIEQRLDEFLSSAFMNQAEADATQSEVAARAPHPFTSFPDYRGIVIKSSSAQRRRISSNHSGDTRKS